MCAPQPYQVGFSIYMDSLDCMGMRRGEGDGGGELRQVPQVAGLHMVVVMGSFW